MPFATTQVLATALSIENITLEAALTAVALFVTVAVWLVDRFLWRSKRLAYRVQLDTPISVAPATGMTDLEIRFRGRGVPDASLVLLRIENTGAHDIEPKDIHVPLSFAFPDRNIEAIQVTETNPASVKEMLRSRFQPEEFIGTGKVTLPGIAINRRDSFKLLVLLTGAGSGVAHAGYISSGGPGGGVVRDTRTRGPLRRSLVFGAVSLLLVGLFVGLLYNPSGSRPDHCLAGQLEITGSTAFESVVKEIRGSYVAECSQADINPDIQVVARGSRIGTRNLYDMGRENPENTANTIAMSDGDADPALASLQRRPIGVLPFAVVINESAGVPSLTLTTDQLKLIYTGARTNWKEFGGQDLPIKMVSRIGPSSGTRQVFQQKVIGGNPELGITSDNCADKDDPASTYHRCEVNTTSELLEKVNNIKGAIGYAELSESKTYPKVKIVAIDGKEPDSANVKNGQYKFWAVENAYTFGDPRPDTLQSAFLDYLSTRAAAEILARNDVIPCDEAPAAFCD